MTVGLLSARHPELVERSFVQPADKSNMWYSASLFFESCHSPTVTGESIWEQRIVLIEAIGEEEALRRASEYGEKEVHSYRNQAGEMVTWRFDSVDRIEKVEADKFRNGLEIFSRFLKDSEITSLKTGLD